MNSIRPTARPAMRTCLLHCTFGGQMDSFPTRESGIEQKLLTKSTTRTKVGVLNIMVPPEITSTKAFKKRKARLKLFTESSARQSVPSPVFIHCGLPGDRVESTLCVQTYVPKGGLQPSRSMGLSWPIDPLPALRASFAGSAAPCRTVDSASSSLDRLCTRA
jgi:hypothetical protein